MSDIQYNTEICLSVRTQQWDLQQGQSKLLVSLGETKWTTGTSDHFMA